MHFYDLKIHSLNYRNTTTGTDGEEQQQRVTPAPKLEIENTTPVKNNNNIEENVASTAPPSNLTENVPTPICAENVPIPNFANENAVEIENVEQPLENDPEKVFSFFNKKNN